MKLTELRPHRVVQSWSIINDGTRTLLESILFPEVALALQDWKRANIKNCALIGGLALSFHGRPRTTDDGDFLFFSYGDIPSEISGFKRTRDHAFRHNSTHVEIEVLDPDFLGFSTELVQKIINTAEVHDGISVASKEGLIVSKLKRFSRQDQADIEHLIRAGADLSSWDVPEDFFKKYLSIKNDV